MTDSEKLTSIIRHVKMVENNCNIISQKLMERDPEFAIAISRRGRVHDASKFERLEFEHLWREDRLFEIALLHHHTNNSHHPEHYRNGVYGMGELDICEMVCDCAARAQEFGTDARIWFLDDEKAPHRYGYKGDQKMYDKLEFYLNILLNKPFG